MSEFQVGDVVRVREVDEEFESSPEYDEILHSMIGQTGKVVAIGYQGQSVIIHADGSKGAYSVLMLSEEIELVHRPPAKEQLSLIEVQS